jgi:hypothetical protein
MLAPVVHVARACSPREPVWAADFGRRWEYICLILRTKGEKMTDATGNGPRRVPIHFKSREEFECRPNYVSTLECERGDLDYIVGKYGFSKAKQMKCGLNGCNNPHWHGFVIATKSGSETHCGRDCGKREFGVSWDDLHAEFERQEKAAARQTLVADLLRDRGELFEQALSLQAQLSDACDKIRMVYDELRKDDVLVRGFESAVANGGRISAEVKVDKSVGGASGQRGGSANLTTVGRILGADAARTYFRIGKTFDWSVVRPLRELAEKTIESMPDEKIEQTSSRFGKFREELVSAQHFIASARQFLSAANAAQFQTLRETLPARSRIDRIYSRLQALFEGQHS